MFPLDVWLTFSAACLLLVLSPGPDNLLVIGRGLSQGPLAAFVSGCSSGAGIVFHVTAATFGLTVLLQTSTIAFLVVKVIGAAYLLFLGFKVLTAGNLFMLSSVERQPLRGVFVTGFLSAALNPKPGLFVLAFIPQFVNPDRGSVTVQILGYGLWFALLTAVGFSLMGVFASRISGWLHSRPGVVASFNFGAGITFVASGLSLAALKQR